MHKHEKNTNALCPWRLQTKVTKKKLGLRTLRAKKQQHKEWSSAMLGSIVASQQEAPGLDGDLSVDLVPCFAVFISAK